MWDEKMRYYRYLSSEVKGNQLVQSEIICVIVTDKVTGREREFLYNRSWSVIEGKFSKVYLVY